MALRKEKEKALKLRKKGMSYSQIKDKLGISKSTLSYWLADYPLSEERIRELRDFNPRRIERCRNTKARKKEDRLRGVYKRVKSEIGKLSKREIMLSGLFLYWGEGFKTNYTTTGIANTDPAMIRFYLLWLKSIDAPLNKIVVKIQIYSDMDKEEAISFWKNELKLPNSCFGQIYIKKSKLSGLSYKNGFGRGTCNVMIYQRDLKEAVNASLLYLQKEVSKI
ncbi:hypothetical protein COB55_03740 [Candidatus Wolfebacteria bacterium]|nr:MAG: hypothetical protein COB55_03740 [Candidatus Wolfebacteria bacterium]